MNGGSIQRLVLLFPGALGDLLLALPAWRRLRRAYAEPATTLVVPEPLRSLARLTGVAGEVASLDDAGGAWLFGGSVEPAWLAGRPAVWTWLGRGDEALRARLDDVASGVRLLRVERGPGDVHAAVAYARAAGVPAPRDHLRRDAHLEPAASPLAVALSARAARPLLAIHRGAGAPGKRWPAERFAAAAAAWRRRTGGDVVELLGPAEAADQVLHGVLEARDWSLPDVAALLRAADAYLGNDSGITHLAGAVGARGAAVFTATDPRRWRPLSRAIVALRGDPGPGRVLRALAGPESLTSTPPGSSVDASHPRSPASPTPLRRAARPGR